MYAALTASSRLGAALQEREPQFEKKEEGDSKQMRGMRNPLQGLGRQQSPVRSSWLLPATCFLHTRGQRPRGGQGLAQGHMVAELGLRSPFFQLEEEQK